jgi:uncharacterized protein YbaA (DUF1428 family)
MQSSTRRNLKIFGIVMVVAMVGSVILPLLQGIATQSQTQTQVTPTAVPVPTYPPPPAVSDLGLDQVYLHPSGLFSVKYPQGWQPGQPADNGTQAQISFSSVEYGSLIETYVAVYDPAPTTIEEVSAYFPKESMQFSWSQYDSANEAAREIEDDKLMIDFELKQGERTFLARHLAWTDGEWVYVTRVVTPQSARDFLLELLDVIPPTITPNKMFLGTPTIWQAYFDPQDKHIIRYPETWELTDSAPGLPASISGDDGVSLRVETKAGQVADEAAATAWVEAAHNDVEVLNVTSVERGDNTGFAVSYAYKNLDGESLSGETVLLNGMDETLHVADLRVAEAGVDLNDLGEDADPAYTTLATVLDTFQVMADLEVAEVAAAG